MAGQGEADAGAARRGGDDRGEAGQGGVGPRRWTVAEAHPAMRAGALVYVDVRSSAEVAEGLPEGAYHVPLFDQDGRGAMQFNAGFLRELQALAAAVAPAAVAVGCAHGVRSRQAALLLAEAGLAVDEVPGGWDGMRDGLGRPLAEGWSHAGLPRDPAPRADRAHPRWKTPR
jgi:rhodanese-related sulfurtransferase